MRLTLALHMRLRLGCAFELHHGCFLPSSRSLLLLRLFFDSSVRGIQLAPWMAAEVPHLVSSGVLSDKVKSKDSDDQKSEPASAAAASSTDA